MSNRIQIDLSGIVGEPPNTPGEILARIRPLTRGDEIAVTIHSPGGSAFDGLGIFEALRGSPAKVVTSVLGLGASAAAIVYLAGDVRRITPSGHLMIHDPSGLVFGRASDHDKMRHILEQLTATGAQIIAERTGNSIEQAKQWLRDETWFNSTEALANGFSHVLHGSASEPQQRWDLSEVYAHAPAAYRSGVKPGLFQSARQFEIAASLDRHGVFTFSRKDFDMTSTHPDAARRQEVEAAAKAEFHAAGGSPRLGGLTEAQFVASRLVDAGLETLGEKPQLAEPKSVEDFAFVEEYRKAGGQAVLNLTEAQFVASRRIDEGLDSL